MLWIILLAGLLIYFIIRYNKKKEEKEFHQKMMGEIRKYEEKFPDRYEFNVKGLHLVSYQKRLAKCDITDEVTLEPEPGNKYDSNAIKVMTDAGLIGYVPAEKTDYVGFLITKDHDVLIDEITNDAGYVNCRIAILYNYKKNKEKN